MGTWNSVKWLVWAALYLVPAFLLPWAVSRSWVQQRGGTVRYSPKQLFERGELGLLSLILASGVLWDLLRSEFAPHTIAAGSVLMAMGGVMAATVWVETYCRQHSGTDWHPQRAWRDSRSLAFFVFSMAAVVEILLDRLNRVAQ
ncbi:MAG TPA: hypothetical protein VFA67_05270 [Candidatus Sulfotelmatobacter sp.]|nr:hypothetical protein [Candidatus Sulfotelmatobacter sp.]